MNKKFLEKLCTSSKNVNDNILSLKAAESFINELLSLLFPHFSEKVISNIGDLQSSFETLESELSDLLRPYCQSNNLSCTELSKKFFQELEDKYELILLDAKAIYDGDPAANNQDVVILAYPGFYAIAVYRVAHWFFQHEIPHFPRFLAEYAHRMTGVDIHPGAKIGKSFCIDHGTGIVIGETTKIGNNVRIYQGVTMGGLSVDKQLANTKRHPTIEDNVVIYANATILGGDTVIGHDSVIGGNVWITASVAPGSLVYHKGETVKREKKEVGN